MALELESHDRLVAAAAKVTKTAVDGALVAGHIRNTFKPSDAEWRDTVGFAYAILTGITDKPAKGDDGKALFNVGTQGGTFGQKAFLNAAFEAAADLGITKRGKAKGDKAAAAPKIPYAAFTVHHLFNVDVPTYVDAADALRDGMIAAAEKSEASRAAVLMGTFYVESQKEGADVAKLQRNLDEALAESAQTLTEQKGKIAADHKRAIAWFKRTRSVLPYVTHILRTLEPAGRKVGGVTFSPDAIVLALAAGYVPSAKDLAKSISNDSTINSAMDQVRAYCRENREKAAKAFAAYVEMLAPAKAEAEAVAAA